MISIPNSEHKTATQANPKGIEERVRLSEAGSVKGGVKLDHWGGTLYRIAPERYKGRGNVFGIQ